MRAARKAAVAAALAAGVGMVAPGSASAVTATVSGDNGENPTPLGGPVTIPNMDPKVTITFSPEEVSQKRDYTLVVVDGAGAVASNSISCQQAGGSPSPARVEYRGNGTYTVILTTYPDTEKFADGCKSGADERKLPFTVTASAPIGALPPQLLLREPNSFSTKPLEIPVGINPGAFSTELRFAAGGVIGPDGGISGPSESASVSSTTGRATTFIRTPGRYVFVARAGRRNAFSPWSPPVFVDVFSPFDFEGFTFTDSRGPSYRVQATLREKTASGRVRIDLARGKRGRYKRLGTVSIRRGIVAKRFRQRRTGRYRMRFTYTGGPTTAPGRIVQGVRFTRRVVFR